jgi:hypothetical protein
VPPVPRNAPAGGSSSTQTTGGRGRRLGSAAAAAQEDGSARLVGDVVLGHARGDVGDGMLVAVGICLGIGGGDWRKSARWAEWSAARGAMSASGDRRRRSSPMRRCAGKGSRRYEISGGPRAAGMRGGYPRWPIWRGGPGRWKTKSGGARGWWQY